MQRNDAVKASCTAALARLSFGRYLGQMPSEFPRHLGRKVENENFPLVAMAAMRDLRRYLDEAEDEALRKALELGAGAEDIADALGITRQGAYYKIKALEKGGRSRRVPRQRGAGDADDDESDAVGVTLPEVSEETV